MSTRQTTYNVILRNLRKLVAPSRCFSAPSTLKGFTLIEVLIVIVLIALLSAILFPVFARVRAQARKTTCLSNLRQIGLGVMQYAQDHNGRSPTGYPFWETVVTSPDEYLPNVMKPYVALEVWNCPAWQALYKPPAPNSPGNYSFVTGTNGKMNNVIGVPMILRPASLSRLRSPSVYPLFFCGAAPSQLPTGVAKLNAHSAITDEQWEKGAVGGTSILYGDSHAKYVVMNRAQWNEIYDTSP
jgi:prepilin-type N-terminal cleavage/methylation domain-containing protein